MLAGPVGLTVGRVQKHQVDIGAVVELLAAHLPQRDHREVGGTSVLGSRLAVVRHQILIDALVRDFDDDVGHGRQLAGDLRQRAQAHHVADHDPQNLAPPEFRQIHGRRHARRKRGFQARAQILDGADALQIHRIEKLLGPLGMLQDFLGQKPAVGEDGHQMAQPDGGARQTIECAGMLLPQAREVVQALFRRGRARQQQIEAILNGRREDAAPAPPARGRRACDPGREGSTGDA